MHGRRSFVCGTTAGVLSAALALLGCRSEPSEAARTGSVDVFVRGSFDARGAGELTLRSEDGMEHWRLPLRVARWQTRRLNLPPGRYTLEHDTPAGVDGSAFATSPTIAGTQPRWVVVAPARATSIVVQIEAEKPATRVATTEPLAGDSIPLN
jgi:hypothetical protein